MKSKLLVFAIITLALLLRIIALSNYPVGFTQDEAGIGYDAYSILKTGRDQWGVRFPLVLRSFGDFKMPLYSYLAIPSVSLFGLNEFAVRLPGAVFGAFTVLSTYLMVKAYSEREDLALWSSFLLAVSPWHIPLSRGAFEANLTVFFMTFGVYGFLRGLKKPGWMFISIISFGLNMFSYHSARYVTPLLFLVLIIFNKNKLWKRSGQNNLSQFIYKYKLSIVILFVFLAAVFYSTVSGASTRGLDITIFNPTDGWKAMADRRLEAIEMGLPETVARLYSNKPIYITSRFIKNYVSYLSPPYLFLHGVGDWGYGMIPGRGVLYLFEIVFVALGLAAFIKKEKYWGTSFFLLWILLAPIPAALTKGGANSGTRAAIMMPAIQVVSAFGIVYFISLIQKSNVTKSLTKLIPSIIVFCYIVSLSSFLEEYIFHEPIQAAIAMQSGYKDMIKGILAVEENYDSVVVSRTLSVPNIWIQFYGQIDPADVQRASRVWLNYEKEGVLYLDQKEEYRLGKYIFGDIRPQLLALQKNTLVVGRLNEFPEGVTTLDTFYYVNHERSFVMVESGEL